MRRLPGDVEAAVEDGLLEVLRPALGPTGEPEFAVIILGHAPLAAVWWRGLLARRSARAVPAESVGVVAGVDPVIERPDETAGLVLEIAATRPAGGPEFLLIRHAVAIGIAMEMQVVGIRLRHEQGTVERQDHARQHEPVDEDAVPVKNAVALAGPKHRDATVFLPLTGALEVVHEGPHLRHEHPSIPIEGNDDRLFDDGITDDQLHAVARWQAEGGELLLGGEVGRGLRHGVRAAAEEDESRDDAFHRIHPR